MKFVWNDSQTHYICCSTEPVRIKSLNFGGSMHDAKLTDMGYVIQRGWHYEGHIYGSVNPEAMPMIFSNIDDAKAYVEEQALVGITLNKLTR